MTQHLADHPEPAAGTEPARIHRLAVLALVFAVVVPPVGVVLGVLVLRPAHRERRDGRLAIGALVLAALVLLGELLLVILLTAGSSAPSTTAAAPSPEPPTASNAAGTAASGSAAADPHGVAAACDVVLPALGQVRTDAAKVTSPDQYGEALTQLANTIVMGAGSTTDPTFLDHVGQLSQAFQKAWQDSSNGKAPSAVADELTAAGAPVSRDCTAAGYHP